MKLNDLIFQDAKQLGLGTPKEILALAMDPPKLENLSVAIRLLKEIGAVLVTATGKETEVSNPFSSNKCQNILKICFVLIVIFDV